MFRFELAKDTPMPRYEYKCRDCDESFEVVHGVNDSVDSCRKCGGSVRRVFHPVGIVFKGSGFYATDAKKPSNTVPTPETEYKPDREKSSGNGDGDGRKDDKKPEKSSS